MQDASLITHSGKIAERKPVRASVLFASTNPKGTFLNLTIHHPVQTTRSNPRFPGYTHLVFPPSIFYNGPKIAQVGA